MSDYVTIKEVARCAGVTIETVRRWDREGKLKPQGRNAQGWRYYLFTDVQEILKDHSSRRSLKVMDENIHTLDLARKLYLAVQREDMQAAKNHCNALEKQLNQTC
ncbi:MAG: MerR family DNA-binding transcriptional regulator [Acidithiobacillus sp.]|nr:MerR family DNA-binding transcriptional regulator [Acidithiobacillus sp.]